jgi:pyrroloquinoline-quinone synthase
MLPPALAVQRPPRMSDSELAMMLRAEAKARFYDRHPLHAALDQGRLTRDQLRGWAANTYYYQTRLPLIDALIVAKSEDREFRRAWIKRVHDHDDEGGALVLWQRLGEAIGLSRSELAEHELVLPNVQEACDEYVEYIAQAPLLAAVAASLTDQLEPPMLQRRIEAFQVHYAWVPNGALQCFRRRISRAKEDGAAALTFVLGLATKPALEEVCFEGIGKKTELLSRLLDEMTGAYGMGWSTQRPRLSLRASLLEDEHGAIILADDRGVRLAPVEEIIVRLCDGTRTLDGIVGALATARPHTDREELQRDVLELLDRLIERRVIDMTPVS